MPITTSMRQALQLGEQLGLHYSLQIPQTAASGLAGSRTGRQTGTSIDFQDYREYQPGDDLRFLDWGVYARTDRLTVKLYREEVIPHLDLIVDGSRSMSLEGTDKASATATLTALLATAATNVQFTRAVWISGHGFQRLPDDQYPPSTWTNFELDHSLNLDQAHHILGPKLRRLGVRVLISDLLWPANPVHTVRRLREGAAAFTVIQLLGRDDATPPEFGSLRLVDTETGETAEHYVDASLSQRYRDNLAALQQAWDNACRQAGARMTTIIAEDLDQSLDRLQSLQLVEPA